MINNPSVEELTKDGLNRYDGKTFETVLDFPEELLPV